MIEEIHQHQSETNKLARKVLKEVAKRLHKKYPEVTEAFKEGDEEVTVQFWTVMQKNKKGMKFNRVGYCAECRKFDLQYEKE